MRKKPTKKKLQLIPDFPLYAHGWNHIYAIVAEIGDGAFVVKIGLSLDPYQRYFQLLPGIPFKSVMLHASVGTRLSAQRAETNLHRIFKPFHSRGEWFRFKLEEKDIFHSACRKVYADHAGRVLDWQMLKDEDASRIMVARQEYKRKPTFGIAS